MMNKKLRKGLNIMICAALLIATLTTTLGPPIVSEAYEVGGMRNRIPPNGMWSQEEWDEIYNQCPRDTYLHPLIDNRGEHKAEGFVIGMTAKSANPANQSRYSSIAYEIKWRGYTFVIGATEIKDAISDGSRKEYFRYIAKGDIVKALVTQCHCSTEQAKELADTMIQKKGDGDIIYSTTYFAFTKNGAIKPTNKRTYASGSLTFDATGQILFKGVRLEEILTGSRTDLLTEFKKAMAYGESGIEKAKQLGMTGSIGDIKRNTHRQISDKAIILGDKREKEEETPVLPPNTRNTRDMITYHTWDNTERNRSKLSSYYVTYNDSRNYDDSEGHHDAFTNEDGNGLVIPSSESFVNGVERARKGCLDLCLDQ